MSLSNEDLRAIAAMLEPVHKEMKKMNERLEVVEGQLSDLKRQQMKSTAELKGMDSLILDEVERVHAILDRHKQDKIVHTA